MEIGQIDDCREISLVLRYMRLEPHDFNFRFLAVPSQGEV
jgi:hypothetical protein